MLTRRQQEIHETIQRHYRQYGYTPNLDEIAKAIGVTARSTVHQHVQTLIRENYLNATEGKAAYELPARYRGEEPQVPLSLPLQEVRYA